MSPRSKLPRPADRPRAVRTLAGCGLVALALALPAAAGAQSPLTASFDVAPEAPAPGETITLTATTTGGSTEPVEHAWDLDGDGEFDDAAGDSAQASFEQAGPHVVRLRARQAGIAVKTSVAERTIEVVAGEDPPSPPPPPPPPPADANQPPVAKYDRACQKQGVLVVCGGLVAREGKPKVLDASPSSDPDGQIVRYEWDLDGNGSFETDGGASPTVTHTFQRVDALIDVKERPVGLRVTDDDGATATDAFGVRVLEPACQDLVVVRDLEISGHCIRTRKATSAGRPVFRHYSEEPVMVNGMLVTPADTGHVTLTAPRGDTSLLARPPRLQAEWATVKMPVEGVIATLSKGRLDWRLVEHELRGFQLRDGLELNGLRITGMPNVPKVNRGTVRLGVHVALPDEFGGATSATPVPLSAGGASASADGPLSFEVPNAALGPIGLDTLKVTYDGVDLWEIEAGVALPAPTDVSVRGEAGIRSNGDFDHAGAEVDFGKGVGPFGPVPVYLKRIAFRIEVDPKKSECVPNVGVVETPYPAPLDMIYDPVRIDYGNPTFALCGSVRLTGGPSILGASAFALDGGLGFAMFDDRPAVLRGFGDISVVEIPVAHGEFEVHSDGYFRVGGRYRWGVPDVFSIRGGMELEAYEKKFNAVAWGDACLDFVDWCRGMRAVVSSKGLAVCLRVDFEVYTWEPGIGYVWGESFPDLYFDGCDIGDYKEHISHKGVASAAAAGEQVVTVAPDLPGTVFAAEGADGPPRITLIGPDGRRIETPEGLEPVEGDGYLLLKDPRGKTTQIAVAAPAAGRWRVIAEEGTLTSLRTAEGLPEPEVEAHVTGSGHKRTLHYEVTPLEGQVVRFVERGPSAGRTIGVADGASGTIAFTPADGAAERREIVAVVEQDGAMRDELDVATYTAPGARKPARVRGLRVTRGGVVRWRPAARAAQYEVRARMASGRRVLRRTERTQVRIPAGRGKVTVRALSQSGTEGRARGARLGGKARR